MTCTGGLYGTEKHGKPVTIDSWVREVHYLVKEEGAWRFLGNAGGASCRSRSGGKRPLTILSSNRLRENSVDTLSTSTVGTLHNDS